MRSVSGCVALSPAAKCIGTEQRRGGSAWLAGRHGGCVAGRREEERREGKNVLPELERRARGDLRRQALRSGAVL